MKRNPKLPDSTGDNGQNSLKAILDTTHDGFILYDRDLNIIICNNAFSQFIKEITGNPLDRSFNLFDLVSPDKREIIHRQIGAVLKGDIVEYEAAYDIPYKRWFHTYVQPVKNDKSEITGICVCVRDITKQKLMEEKARHSESYMKVILDSTPEALFLINPDYDIIIFNPRARIVMAKFLKVDIKCGMNLVEILPDFRKEDVKEKLDYVSLGNFIEYEVQYPDASWLLVSFSPVKNKEGNLIEICVGLRDISSRKNMEYKLRKIDQRYRSLVDSLSEGVIFQSFDKRIITFNNSAIQILGIEREKLQKYGFPLPGSIILNEKNEKLDIKGIIRTKAYEGQSTKGLIAGIENGPLLQWLFINIEPVKNEEGLYHACIISFSDMTATFKNRDELNLLSKVVKETSNIVVITDAGGKIIWANDTFTKISGYPLDEALNKKPGHLLGGPEKDKKEVARMKDCISKGIPVEGEILNYSKKGNKYWTYYNIHPVKDENGKLVKFFSVQTDITEPKRMKEEIAREKEERQKDKIRATIKGQEKERNEIGRELHDNIQQILAATKLYLESSLRMGPNTLQFIQNSFENVNLAIEEVRNFSRRLVAPRFNDRMLTDEIKVLLNNLGLSAMVLLDAENLDEKALPDEIKLTIFRVIQEQLNNIIKHAKAKSIIIQLENNNKGIALFIKDDGIGFQPEQKQNGIGLSNICSRIELCNGSTKITSAPGKGCQLQIAIPLKT